MFLVVLTGTTIIYVQFELFTMVIYGHYSSALRQCTINTLDTVDLKHVMTAPCAICGQYSVISRRLSIKFVPINVYVGNFFPLTGLDKSHKKWSLVSNNKTVQERCKWALKLIFNWRMHREGRCRIIHDGLCWRQKHLILTTPLIVSGHYRRARYTFLSHKEGPLKLHTHFSGWCCNISST